MFSFFKRKKSSDDKAPESTAPSDASVPAATPDESPVADPVVTVTADPAIESFAVKGDAAAGEPDVAATNTKEPEDDKIHLASEASSGVPPKSHVPVPIEKAVPRDEPLETAHSLVSGEQLDAEEAVKHVDIAAEKSGLSVDAVKPANPVESDAEEPAKQVGQPKGSWLARLKKGLSRTGQNIGGLFVDVKLDDELYEELETALIMADAGVEAATQLLESLRTRVRKERLMDAMQARAALRDILTEHLKPLEKEFPLGSVKPLIMMIAGVNGAGKTTSIGKLANTFQAEGAQVLLAAGDTFRAAAREQLLEWGSRNNVTVIAQEGGDPAAVAFDAVNAGRARQADVVMIDTAGRLPTQLHLMEELKKIKRVVHKADGNAPHEVLLVVDGNSGQNVIAQIRAFDAAIGLTGLVVTKLDGTAKGGILAAVAAGSQGVRPVPVYWIGVGEGIHDLQPFRAHEFSAALIGDPEHAPK